MDSIDAVPGLFRGPTNWALGTRALSIFSPHNCVRTLESVTSLPPDIVERARAGIESIVASRIGGDCWSAPIAKPATSQATLLVVSPPPSGATNDAWNRLIAAVANERGQEKVALLAPAAMSGRVRAALVRTAAEHDMELIDRPVDAWSLIENISSLYTIDDELGFLALLKGIRVRCFGGPFYAGWGLTDDDAATARRPNSA